jgi:5'-3' exonuclease
MNQHLGPLYALDAKSFIMEAYHLASITHHDTKPYTNTTKEIKHEINALLALVKEKNYKGRRQR